MIIDFHTHTFPDKIAGKAIHKLSGLSHTIPFSDGTVEGLRKNAQRAGIGLSVVLPVATSAEHVRHINDFAIAQNEKEHVRDTETQECRAQESCGQSRIFSFGAMHHEMEDYRAELARIAGAGLKGIKVHPYYHGCNLNDPKYLRILDRAAEVGLIVVTHAGYDVGFPGAHFCTVPMLREVMQTIGKFPFVAAHMGGWKEWEQVPELLADTGIYLDTSFSTGEMKRPEGDDYWKPEECPMLDEEAFAEIVRAFPEGHILFGTDSPWTDPEESVAFIRNAPLPEETKQEILGGAAERLLHISSVTCLSR